MIASHLSRFNFPNSRFFHSPCRIRRLNSSGIVQGPKRIRLSRFTAIKSSQISSQVSVVLGTQWGDEGKGKLVDILAQENDVVCRAQGGANAGHTIYDPSGNKYALHVVPSGILNPAATCVIGNGVVVNLPGLVEELDSITSQGVDLDGRLMISDRAHVLLDIHKEIDGLRELELAGEKIGTTKRGIGPAYAAKANRIGLRMCDLRHQASLEKKTEALIADAKLRFDSLVHDSLEKELETLFRLKSRILPFISDTVSYVNHAFDLGKKILIEGGQATMLDIDFGTYPFVTSSNPSIGGCISGLGLAPNKIQSIIGVTKAYTTRVGAGPYPTEIFGPMADQLREAGGEYGTTTGRPRRVGWLDMVALKYTTRINGLTHINITKLDVLSDLDQIQIGVGYKTKSGDLLESVPADLETLSEVEVVYESLSGWKSDISRVRVWDDLPIEARSYIDRIEELTGVYCQWIGVGPSRDAMVLKPQSSVRELTTPSLSLS
eukprot:g98.t1